YSIHPHSPTPILPLSLHDALPISLAPGGAEPAYVRDAWGAGGPCPGLGHCIHAGVSGFISAYRGRGECRDQAAHSRFRTEHTDRDRKSTRLNSSHVAISYAVFCLK